MENDYYGMLVDIVELEYTASPTKRLVLFKCECFDPSPQGIRVDNYGNVEIRKSRRYQIYDPLYWLNKQNKCILHHFLIGNKGLWRRAAAARDEGHVRRLLRHWNHGEGYRRPALADPSNGSADDVQLPPAMTLSKVRAEAGGNGGLRRAIAFGGGTAEGERNLGYAIEQRRSGRLRPWLHEGKRREGRPPPWFQDRATRQRGVWFIHDLFIPVRLKVRGDGSLRSSVVVGVSNP
ncbi:hypothetical protein SESBI_48237 [Sesbania bispinosa]|nr:hypothetical protein SESBI_48237 [Sesbania bispinosa]